jgi:hypothetical protein
MGNQRFIASSNELTWSQGRTLEFGGAEGRLCDLSLVGCLTMLSVSRLHSVEICCYSSIVFTTREYIDHVDTDWCVISVYDEWSHDRGLDDGLESYRRQLYVFLFDERGRTSDLILT